MLALEGCFRKTEKRQRMTSARPMLMDADAIKLSAFISLIVWLFGGRMTTTEEIYRLRLRSERVWGACHL